jgi:hypothetical protein
MTLLLSLSTLLTLTALPIAPTQAGSNIHFFCHQTEINGKLIPVTYIRNPSQTRKMIIWEKTLGGQNPLQRCNQVSDRLQEAVDKNQLNMITTGIINKQKVICTTDKYDGACQTVLLTLEPNENKWEILETLKYILQGKAILPISQ